MYLMYVDESGDSGLLSSPSNYFVLTGLVVHELRWKQYLDQLIDFRKRMKRLYGLRLRDELHAAHLISRPGPLISIKKYDRLAIIRHFADELAAMSDLSIINVVVKKGTCPVGYSVFEMAWKALIQRFENTMSHRNFAGPANPDERGMLFPDHTDDKKLTRLLREMRRYNPITHDAGYSGMFGPGYRNLFLARISEDPNFRDSTHSYFIQAADLAAFLLYQHLAPSNYMKRKGGNNYFSRLVPILTKAASRTDPQGIVYLCR
jgi:hypothetical protein